ncbi:hypothetical protein SK128_012480 [Halocaridina rubra]|uniref:Uncharacterized protein n=1 Tax=Halocaridina rubra TaxID=373956 RepID=A0AAN9A7J4_HALRR
MMDTFFFLPKSKLGRGDIVRALLAAGADPGVQDNEGNTPLQLAPTPSIIAIFTEELLRATAQSDVGRVCQLVAAGLSINSYDNPLSRNTPLHWAASFADVDTLTCLLARGADVNAANSDGATPLHDAVARGEENVIQILLEHDANPHIQCFKGRHKGKTAFDIASRKPQLQSFMEDYAASIIEKAPEMNGSAACNGSVSPLMSRRSLDRELTTSRGISGSLESLVSMGTDSVLTGVEPGVNGVVSSRKISVESPTVRSPLQSSSSLEMSPCMEQVCERLASSHLTAPPRPLVTHSSLHLLWPQPRRITEVAGPSWIPPSHATLAIVAGVEPVHKIVDVWDIHKQWLEESGCHVSLGGVVGSHDPPDGTVPEEGSFRERKVCDIHGNGFKLKRLNGCQLSDLTFTKLTCLYNAFVWYCFSTIQIIEILDLIPLRCHSVSTSIYFIAFLLIPALEFCYLHLPTQ